MREILVKFNFSDIYKDERFSSLISLIIVNACKRRAVYKLLLLLLHTENRKYSVDELQKELHFGSQKLYRILSLLKEGGVVSSRDLNIDEIGKPQHRLIRYSISKVIYRALILLFIIKVVQIHSHHYKKVVKKLRSN